MKKLSKKSEKIINDFSEIAQRWGYEQSEGTVERAAFIENQFNVQLLILKAYVSKLEEKNKKLKNDINKILDGAYNMPTG